MQDLTFGTHKLHQGNKRIEMKLKEIKKKEIKKEKETKQRIMIVNNSQKFRTRELLSRISLID